MLVRNERNLIGFETVKSMVFWLVMLCRSEECITFIFSQARNQKKQVASSANHLWKIQPDINQSKPLEE
jgi:hypothetical protein